MKNFQKGFIIEKSLIYILIIGIIAVGGFLFYLFFVYGQKSITLLSPKAGEELEIGKTYQIAWKAKGIKRVGIVLFNPEKKAKLIAKNVEASKGVYDWTITTNQELGDNFWIAVFQYPWKEKNKISYSNSFSIVYSGSSSCDKLSTDNEWPYLSSYYPNIRRIFITEKKYNGNLGGLEGADKICQSEAENMNLEGKWHAFLGGDLNEETAIQRILSTPRGTSGVFVEAKPASELAKGGTCHRLIAKNFDSFLKIISNPLWLNQQKIDNDFLKKLAESWLGRINVNSPDKCIYVSNDQEFRLYSKYSYTTSCQKWKTSEEKVKGYENFLGDAISPSFPTCYTPTGELINAMVLGGLSEGIIEKENKTQYFSPQIGRSCNSFQRIICIEE